MIKLIMGILLAATSASYASENSAKMLADRTRDRLGEKWVQTALVIGKMESGYRCDAVGPHTKHGRAQGIMQVLPGSARALGVSPAILRTCEGGIEAGLRHMQLCINSGVTTHDQMTACHVAGAQGWKTRLRGRQEAYKRKYVRIAARR